MARGSVAHSVGEGLTGVVFDDDAVEKLFAGTDCVDEWRGVLAR